MLSRIFYYTLYQKQRVIVIADVFSDLVYLKELTSLKVQGMQAKHICIEELHIVTIVVFLYI